MVPTIGILEALVERAPDESSRRRFEERLGGARKRVALAHQPGVKLGLAGSEGGRPCGLPSPGSRREVPSSSR